MTKISALAALTAVAAADVLPVVDVSDTSMAVTGTTKKATVADVAAASAGLKFLTGGGTLSLAMITAAQSAGWQGIFLDPRFVWDASGLILADIANFVIESRMAGSIGYSNTIAYNTGGYVATGSAADGIQVYGTTGGGAQGLVMRGLALVGSNSNAVLHWGGRHRRCRLENCFVYNTSSASGAYAMVTDTALNNANGEDNALFHVDLAGAWAALGIGIADQAQHCNDCLYEDLTTSGGTYAVVANYGGNHVFANFYDRSHPATATIWNHGAHLIFLGGENGNDGSHGGITYLCDTSGGNTVLRDATLTAGATPTDILHLSNGTFSLLGKMRSNNACALVLSGGSLWLAGAEGGLANVTVSGSGGSLYLAGSYLGSGAPTVSWSGTPVYPGPGVVASGHANGQTTTQTVTWTPPAVGTRFRVSVWLQVTVAGTSTIPSLSFAQAYGTAFNQRLPMWKLDSADTPAVTTLCAATGTYAGTFSSETDTSATAVTVTITPTGSTYRYSVAIERVA